MRKTGRRKSGSAAEAQPSFQRKEPAARRQELVDAAIRCLSRDGIAGFTIGNICDEAGVSRGLIGHYFESKEKLLVEVYRTALFDSLTHHIGDPFSERDSGKEISPEERLLARIDSMFSPTAFSRDSIRIWLAMWEEAATNPKLGIGQRRLFSDFYKAMADEIAAVATKRGRKVEPVALARTLIALFDGLWVSWCMDPSAETPEPARNAFCEVLELYLGPIRPAR